MPNARNHRRLALAFSREVIEELSFDGRRSYALSSAINESRHKLPRTPRLTYAGVLDHIYDELAARYRCQYLYKNELARSLILGGHGVGGATLLAEVRVRDCVADLAVITDTSTAYEIKSELDSVARLGKQLDAYRKLFARIFVVTHESQLAKVRAASGADAGIILLTDSLKLETVREATSDPGRVDPGEAMSCLRQAEYTWAVAQAFGEAPQVPNTYIYTACRNLFTQLKPERAHELLVAALRRRPRADKLGPFVDALPRSLKALGLTQPLSGLKRGKLLDALDRPYKDAYRAAAQRRRFTATPPASGETEELPPIPF